MIKSSTILNELLKDPTISQKYNKRYIHGVVKEYFLIQEYKKHLNELALYEVENEENNNDEEEVEIEPEKIVVEPETQDEPEVEVEPEPEEIQDEPEVEPEVVPEKIPLEPKPKSEPGGYEAISSNQARELLSYKGKIFNAVFTKKTDGSLRAMNGMTGVRKYTSGGELPYSPKDKNVIPVYDLKVGAGSKGYRMLNVDGLKTLAINGKKYKIDHSLKENKSPEIDKLNRIWNKLNKEYMNLDKQNDKEDNPHILQNNYDRMDIIHKEMSILSSKFEELDENQKPTLREIVKSVIKNK